MTEPILSTSTQELVIHNLVEVSPQDSWTLYGVLATIIIAITGWFFTAWRQQKNFKQEQQAKINFDIYSQLVTAHKELQDAIGTFNASTQAPLILMSAELIPLEVQEQMGGLATTNLTEAEALHKGRVKYSEWLYEDLLSKEGDYFDKLIRFIYLTEDWTAPLGSLQHALRALQDEVERLNASMRTHRDSLQHYARANGDDWRTWDREDVYRHGTEISSHVMTVSSYVHDFMVLVHNELLAPYYGKERRIRKTLDDSFLVLTKKGLVTRIEDDPEVRAVAEEIIRQNTQQ